jgi:hypothetical protein
VRRASAVPIVIDTLRTEPTMTTAVSRRQGSGLAPCLIPGRVARLRHAAIQVHSKSLELIYDWPSHSSPTDWLDRRNFPGAIRSRGWG